MKPNSLSLRLGTTSQAYQQSFGEVKLAETFDKKGAPIEGGFFCHKIFGVPEEYTCTCRKYQGESSPSGVCDACGAELLSRLELGSRFGHIALAAPVIHPWFYKAAAAILGVTEKELDALASETSAWVSVVSSKQKMSISVGDVLNEVEQHKAWTLYGDDAFEVESGLEVIHRRLSEIDLETLYLQKKQQLQEQTSQARRGRLTRELQSIEALYLSKQSPQNLMIEVLPVIPAIYRQQEDSRPKEIVDDETGEITIEQSLSVTSLYKKVFQRNKRLQKLQEMSAPAIILRQEKIMLSQLIRELFAGIQSTFSQNPQEKTVDYSGHAVFVTDPSHTLSQCGVPISMARTMWGPFLMARLRDEGLASSVAEANLLLDEELEDAYTILQEVMREHPVLLSPMTPNARAMLPMDPILTKEDALSIHPMVAQYLSRSPDGEHVAIHVLFSREATKEARQKLGILTRLLSPLTFDFDWMLSDEALFGLFSLTKDPPSTNTAQAHPRHMGEVVYAYESGLLGPQDVVSLRHQKQNIQTTAGRVLLASILPKEIDFALINQPQTRSTLQDLLRRCAEGSTAKSAASVLSQLGALGSSLATKLGASLCIDDFVTPPNKEETLQRSITLVNNVLEQYYDGLITEGERYNKIVDIWRKSSQTLNELVSAQLQQAKNNLWAVTQSTQNALSEQLCAAAGIFTTSSGEILDTPGFESLREGFSTITYFLKSIQSRANELRRQYKDEQTRELQEKIARVTREIQIIEQDCKTPNGLLMKPLWPGESLAPYLIGRYLAHDIGALRASSYLTKELAEGIANKYDKGILVRSPLTCESRGGVCQMCYGARDIQQDAVGFFAAHTVQTTASLTLSTDRQTAIKTITASRKGTFHLVNATIAINSDGECRVLKRGALYTIKRDDEILCERELPYGVSLQVKDEQLIEEGQIIASYDESITPLLAEQTGVLRFDALYSMINYELDPITGISSQIVKAPILSTDPYPSIKITHPQTSAVLVEQYIPVGAIVIPMDGTEVKAGDLLAKILLKNSLQIRSAHDLFEVVPPRTISPLAAFDGTISYGRTHYEHGEIVRMMRLRSPPEDGAEVKEYVLSAWQTLLVQEGEQVTAGTALAEGEVDLNELLEVSGPHEVARFFLKHLRTQTQMPPQHVELILRRMLSLVKITASGDSGLEEGEVVSRSQWQEEVERLLNEDRTPPTAETLLLGVSALREHQRLSIQSLYEASAKTLSRLALSGEAVEN